MNLQGYNVRKQVKNKQCYYFQAQRKSKNTHACESQQRESTVKKKRKRLKKQTEFANMWKDSELH